MWIIKHAVLCELIVSVVVLVGVSSAVSVSV